MQNVFGNKCRELRILRGMSVDVLAQRADCSHAQIFKYERGDNLPSSDKIMKIASILGVPAGMLLGDETLATDFLLPSDISELNKIRAELIDVDKASWNMIMQVARTTYANHLCQIELKKDAKQAGKQVAASSRKNKPSTKQPETGL